MINCENEKETRLIHWSSAEPSVMKSKLTEHNLKLNFEWFDLLNVFKNNEHPIVIKECHSFGLKNIVILSNFRVRQNFLRVCLHLHHQFH